jgi:hypothetical protein
MSGARRRGPVTDVQFGENPDSLLAALSQTVSDLEEENASGGLEPGTVALIPRYLRTFFLRFLSEVLDIRIRRFSEEERDQISDQLVDFESAGEHESAWPLLSDFVDLCDYFTDYGLMSVPEAAEEHERSILEIGERIIEDLAEWADKGGKSPLKASAARLSRRLGKLTLGAD